MSELSKAQEIEGTRMRNALEVANLCREKERIEKRLSQLYAIDQNLYEMYQREVAR